MNYGVQLLKKHENNENNQIPTRKSDKNERPLQRRKITSNMGHTPIHETHRKLQQMQKKIN